MTRGQLSISSAMSIVLVVAVGFAALKDPSELWASALFTSAVVVFLASILGAVARRGRSRMAWFGSALFGGSYLVLCFGPGPWLNNEGLRPPPLLTTVLLNKFKDEKYLVSKGWTSVAFNRDWDSSRVSFDPTVITAQAIGITNSRTGKITFYASPAVRFDISPYKQIAHSIGSLLFAAVGCCLSLAFTARYSRESQ